jgi:hypothetical protein
MQRQRNGNIGWSLRPSGFAPAFERQPLRGGFFCGTGFSRAFKHGGSLRAITH